MDIEEAPPTTTKRSYGADDPKPLTARCRRVRQVASRKAVCAGVQCSRLYSVRRYDARSRIQPLIRTRRQGLARMPLNSRHAPLPPSEILELPTSRRGSGRISLEFERYTPLDGNRLLATAPSPWDDGHDQALRRRAANS